MNREWARKSVHVAMGGFAFLMPYLTWWQACLLAAMALLHNLFVLPLYGGRKIFRGAAAERGLDVGIVLYPASVLALTVLFARHPPVIAAAWGLLAFGDGMATIIGLWLGRHTSRLPWNRDKSWAGWIGFFVFGGIAVLGLWRWTAGVPLDGEVVAKLLIVTAVVALLESLPLGVDDNIVVPLAGAGLLLAATTLDVDALLAGKPLFLARLPWALAVNVLLAAVVYRARLVDRAGAVHGSLLGVALWVFGGGEAFLMLLLFFLLGNVATKVGYKTKLREGTAQEKGGRRGAPHAWANAGAGALFALLLAGSPPAMQPLLLIAIVAAFATATADTLGSEIGQAYGRRTFLITTFKPVPRGTDGAVSLEGTLAGIAGSFVLAIVAYSMHSIDWLGVLVVVVAAFVGTTVESYVGAVFERAKQINNEAQNLLNTMVGGLVALALMQLCQRGWR